MSYIKTGPINEFIFHAMCIYSMSVYYYSTGDCNTQKSKVNKTQKHPVLAGVCFPELIDISS